MVVARDHYETVAVAQHLERAPCPGGRDEERCEACHCCLYLLSARLWRLASVSWLPTVLGARDLGRRGMDFRPQRFC